MPTGLLGIIEKKFESTKVSQSWEQWEGEVAIGSPTFLLLLSHTTTDGTSNLPALEISKDVLSVGLIEDSYVKGPATTAPVVFLMGCSTIDPKMGFLSFVQRFKLKRAALVVGTLSTISAKRAARFLKIALPILKDPGNEGRTFGEVFLDVKRAVLASGDGFALTLIAYGDTGWQL